MRPFLRLVQAVFTSRQLANQSPEDQKSHTVKRTTRLLTLLMLTGMLRPCLADTSIDRLRCEYLADPLGIDATKPRLSWVLQSNERAERQTAYQVLVASTLKVLEKDRGDLWDSGRVESDLTIHVEYAGKPLASKMRCFWKVRVWDIHGRASSWSKPASWSMGLLKRSDWNAQWIAAPGANDTVTGPATMLRKDFCVRGAIRRATVYVTGLGLYEMRINGQRIGNHLLAPEWTRYSNRIQYQTYDVTQFLRNGTNVLGAQLSGGWWTGPLQIQKPLADPKSCLLLRLEIELADGTTQTIVTDASWQANVDGPIRRAGIYIGETYDATKEMPGWDRPSFAAIGWHPVQVLPNPKNAENATLVAQCNEPICIQRELRPIKMTEPKPGVYVFDMGQNMVGWCRFRANAASGTKIMLQHAEMLNKDGTIYTANLRGNPQVVEYTWHGGEAVVEPHFTYHGFRYVAVTGLPNRPRDDAITGLVFHSASPEAGEFSCSSELINQIMHCVAWVQRANMMGVPTDCPQRGERLGWMGDIQAFSQTAIFNRDMAGFFTKWVRDIRDSQAADGRYPDVAPHVDDPNVTFSGVPAWGDAGTIVPWRMYQNYADVRVLAEHFDSARRWVDFIHSKNPNFLWQKDRGFDYNDWLNGDTVVLKDYPRGISAIPNEVFATAFFAHSTEIVAKMAHVLGRTDDAAKYDRLFQNVKSAFQKAYVAADGHIVGDTQAGYALALHFNLLDESLRPKAAEHLLTAITKYKNHVSTGIQTTHRLMMALSDNAHHGEAWRLANLRTVPSWGYMVDQGATTIWERWDGYVKGLNGQWGDFQDPGMNSFNHWALGAVGEWVWRELAGINPAENAPGYKHVVIRPRPIGDLRWAKARYDSIRGPIVSEWKIADGQFQLEVAIPANTTATVFLPAKHKDSVNEGETSAAKAVGVRFIHMEADSAVFEIASGRYRFCVTQ